MPKQPYEIPNLQEQLVNTKLQAWAILGLGSVALGLSLSLPLSKAQRAVGIVTGLVTISASGVSSEREQKMAQQIADIQDISHAEQSYNVFSWLRSLTPNPSLLGPVDGDSEATEAKLAPYQTYNADDLTMSPHWAILGSTGSGKSIFLHYLMDTFLGGQAKLILDPHADPKICTQVHNQQEAIEVIRQLTEGELDSVTIGGGRDYSQISMMVEASYDEMDRRYSTGKAESFRTINVVVDEAVSVALHDASKDSWKATQVAFLTEARKANIRLILLLQTALVKAMGLEGNSELRNAYTWLRIGEFALKHANQMKNQPLIKQLEKDIQASLKDHKQSGSTALYSGSCYLIDEKYWAYQNLGFYYRLRGLTEPTLEDLRQQAFGEPNGSTTKQLPEPTSKQPTEPISEPLPEQSELAKLAEQVAFLTNKLQEVPQPPPSYFMRQQGIEPANLEDLLVPNLVPKTAPETGTGSTAESTDPKALAESAFEALEATCVSEKGLNEPPEPLTSATGSQAATIATNTPKVTVKSANQPTKVVAHYSPEPAPEMDSATFKVVAGYADKAQFTREYFRRYLEYKAAGVTHSQAIRNLGYPNGGRKFSAAARCINVLKEYYSTADQIPEGLLMGN